MNGKSVLAVVFSRNAFYRRLHFLALATFTLTLIVIGFLIWVLYFLVKNPSHPLYFATDNVGRLIEIVPVEKPNMSLADVTAWTIEAVEKSYSYDYVNYRSQLQNAQKYFTRYGWANYMRALSRSDNLLGLTSNKQIVIAQVVDAPKLITQGILAGAYAYKFEMPMLITFWQPPFSDTSKYSNPWIVSVIVQRQPILQSYKGLGIVQLIAASTTTTEPNQPQQLSNTPT